jgi:hypothetical protein
LYILSIELKFDMCFSDFGYWGTEVGGSVCGERLRVANDSGYHSVLVVDEEGDSVEGKAGY